MTRIDYDTAILISTSLIAASCACLVYIFATALWRDRIHWRSFRYREDTGAAIAKIIIFGAGGMSRVSGGIIIKMRMAGYDTTWYEDHVHSQVSLWVGFWFVLGCACLARVYSETNKEWLGLVGFTAVATLLAVFVPI